MNLRIYIRQMQLFNLAGTPIIYSGNNPATLVTIPGTVSKGKWVEVTDSVVNLEKMTISFTVKRDSTGAPSREALSAMKSATQPLTFEGDAYAFLREWLIDSVSAPHNKIEVKIEHVGCGEHLDFSIKSTDISWCTNQECSFDVVVKYQDPDLFCVQNTVLEDNWQGWFQPEPAGGKKHPRFSYCNEERPNAKLIVIWYMIGHIAFIVLTVLAVVFAVVNVIIGIINAIIDFLNALGDLFNWDDIDHIDYLDYGNVVDFFARMYIESAGCGREHPAPLVRDYITNVCDKCGVKVDASTAPIFFAERISLQASTRDLKNVPNPHYNACYLTAKIKRGIRRWRNNPIFGDPTMNDTEMYIPDNSPLMNLPDFLDRLKQVYNAEWRISGSTLYFYRKDWFIQGPTVFDFDGADRDKMLDGLCFEWSELKQGAAVRGLYSIDPADGCGNEALRQMNGMVGFARTENNPNYEGMIDKTTRFFGGTKFRLDGASTDYIYDAAQVLVNAQLLGSSFIQQFRKLSEWLDKYAAYVLLLKDETHSLDKLLIWDGKEYLNAKAIATIVPVNNELATLEATPVINPKYNQDSDVIVGTRPPEEWVVRHLPETHVIGSAWTPGGVPTGIYRVSDMPGGLVMHNPAKLVNYPLYFEPGYLDTLWDWFHWVDDPIANPQMRLSWRVKIDLCCDYLKRLNIFNALGGGVKLPAKVRLPIKYYPDGRLEEVEVVYDATNDLGAHIELKGTA